MGGATATLLIDTNLNDRDEWWGFTDVRVTVAILTDEQISLLPTAAALGQKQQRSAFPGVSNIALAFVAVGLFAFSLIATFCFLYVQRNKLQAGQEREDRLKTMPALPIPISAVASECLQSQQSSVRLSISQNAGAKPPPLADLAAATQPA